MHRQPVLIADSSDAPRILIVRLSAIGDVVHTLPVLCALRERLPLAFLAWIVEGRAGDLLEGHSALDRLVRIPRGWLKSPRSVLHVRRQLCALNFDIAIDVQGLFKSAVAARLSGSPVRIGFAGAAGREMSEWLNTLCVRPRKMHIVERNLELLAPLGIQRPDVRFDLPERSADRKWAHDYLAAGGVAGDFVIINPGAGWPSKLWPPERFAAVARTLGEQRRLPSLVVWAGAAERSMAEGVAGGSGGHARIVPDTTLTQLAALVRRARLFVASDTGPLHIAVAAGTPSVGLFGPMAHERNGPYGPRHVAVQRRAPEPDRRRFRRTDLFYMDAIRVDDVLAACATVLDRPRPADDPLPSVA